MVNTDPCESYLSCPVCDKPADKRCSACQSVSYCCADHQKRHWKIHKLKCRCYTIKRNDVYGRYIVATRDIPEGTIVLVDEPLIIGPKRCTAPVCLGCHKPLQENCHRCSRCTYPMCSTECENAPIHANNECPIFQRAAHPVGSKISDFVSMCPAYECISPLRCLLLKARNAAKWEKASSMEHHNELRRTVPGLWNRSSVNVSKLLLEWCKMKEEFDEEAVHSVIGIIDVNSFEIKFKDVAMCGLYQEAALMCHDCVPNTHNAIAITEDHRMIVRASVPIRKGEMITTSYASQLAGTLQRRNFLKETKYFDCFCRRCVDSTEFSTYIQAVKCSCATGFLLPKDPVNSMEWVCSSLNNDTCNGNGSCGKNVKYDQVQGILLKASKEIDEACVSTAGSKISRLERVLKKYSGKVLHPNHYLLLCVIKDLNYLYALGGESEESIDKLTRAKGLCEQLLDVLDQIDPGLSRLRGVTLYQFSKYEFHIARHKFQTSEITKSEFKTSLARIEERLKTCHQIMELDKVILANSPVSSSIVDLMALVKESFDTWK